MPVLKLAQFGIPANNIGEPGPARLVAGALARVRVILTALLQGKGLQGLVELIRRLRS